MIYFGSKDFGFENLDSKRSDRRNVFFKEK